MTATDPTPVAPTHIPQSSPLWAVHVAIDSIADETAAVGLVIAWEVAPDRTDLTPVVAEVPHPDVANLANPLSQFAGQAGPWLVGTTCSDIERVEFFPTREEAAGRARSLLDEVRAVWPASARVPS